MGEVKEKLQPGQSSGFYLVAHPDSQTIQPGRLAAQVYHRRSTRHGGSGFQGFSIYAMQAVFGYFGLIFRQNDIENAIGRWIGKNKNPMLAFQCSVETGYCISRPTEGVNAYRRGTLLPARPYGNGPNGGTLAQQKGHGVKPGEAVGYIKPGHIAVGGIIDLGFRSGGAQGNALRSSKVAWQWAEGGGKFPTYSR